MSFCHLFSPMRVLFIRRASAIVGGYGYKKWNVLRLTLVRGKMSLDIIQAKLSLASHGIIFCIE